MDLIQHALAEVKAQISPQLLARTYNNPDDFGFQVTSINDYIKKNIITCRVLRDCNILGGQEMYIETRRATKIKQMRETSIYIYKASDWMGNGLITVTDFRSGNMSPYGGCSSGGTSGPPGDAGILGDAYKHAEFQARRKEEAYDIGGSSLVRIIGDNAISIQNTLVPPIGVFTVIIGHNPDLTDMGRRTAIFFSKMVVAAVKADIYNTTLLSLAEGDASRGFILTSISDVVNSYSDAEEEYQDYRLRWGARAFENDPLRHDEFVKDQISTLDTLF